MINKINTSQLQEILANTASKQSRPAEPQQKPAADASLQANCASLIKKANAGTEVDRAHMQKVKELLENGQLDNSENIRLAAKNIVRFGV